MVQGKKAIIERDGSGVFCFTTVVITTGYDHLILEVGY